MGIVDTLKETVGLIQKVDNIDLYRRMLELQAQVLSLVEENRVLRENLADRQSVTFRDNAYWQEDGSSFCSKCFDVEQKLVRLHLRKGFHPQCPGCGSVAVNPESAPPQSTRRVSRSSFLSR